MLIVAEEWKNAYPGACVGIMAVCNAANPEQHGALELKKAELADYLKSKFKTKECLLACEPLQPYADYYKRYKKTYHVLLQMESVIFKGKQLPSVAALVESMFMAELKNGLLTAGHDAQTLKMPLKLGISKGDERYIGISGKEQLAKQDDMLMYDGEGIIGSVLYGPDLRTKIMPNTNRSVFVVYAPPGIKQGAIERHFDEIVENIKLFAPEVAIEFRKVYEA